MYIISIEVYPGSNNNNIAFDTWAGIMSFDHFALMMRRPHLATWKSFRFPFTIGRLFMKFHEWIDTENGGLQQAISDSIGIVISALYPVKIRPITSKMSMEVYLFCFKPQNTEFDHKRQYEGCLLFTRFHQRHTRMCSRTLRQNFTWSMRRRCCTVMTIKID